MDADTDLPDPWENAERNAESRHRARAAYRDDSYPERACDKCERPYRGPSVYCSLECALADSGSATAQVDAACMAFDAWLTQQPESVREMDRLDQIDRYAREGLTQFAMVARDLTDEQIAEFRRQWQAIEHTGTIEIVPCTPSA